MDYLIGFNEVECSHLVVEEKGGVAVMAVNASRSQKLELDEHIYKERHKIENLFGKLERLRRIATRYEKLYETFVGMLAIACVIVWLKW